MVETSRNGAFKLRIWESVANRGIFDWELVAKGRIVEFWREME